MLAMYEKNHIFLLVFVCFVWLLSKYKRSFFLFLLRFTMSPEAATRGVLYKNLFMEILQYSWENTCIGVLAKT